jgi:hypothetical protein
MIRNVQQLVKNQRRDLGKLNRALSPTCAGFKER